MLSTALRKRVLAWFLLTVMLSVALYLLGQNLESPRIRATCLALVYAGIGYSGVRLAALLVLDPLLRHRKTETPGFARDLILVVAYGAIAFFILRNVVHVDIGALLGTGAIVAAVVGLSLQETLGNLFAGISLHLDPAFKVGDWVELGGTLRGSDRRETLVGQVLAITWRAVHLRTEDGDTDIVPNRVLAQALITNLHHPAGDHRRTARVVVAPHPELHQVMSRLEVALAGFPHGLERPPEVVARDYRHGGVVLEMRWWSPGFSHSRAGHFHAMRLAAAVLPREGVALVGPSGSYPLPLPVGYVEDAQVAAMVDRLGLPSHWVAHLKPHLRLRSAVSEEGVIRQGDPGHSLFAIISGSLSVVRPRKLDVPAPAYAWEVLATLEPGDLFGEASLLTGAPRNATVVAATDVLMMELPKAGFEASLRKEPQVVEWLADLMTQRSQEREQQGSETLKGREHWLRQIRTWFAIT